VGKRVVGKRILNEAEGSRWGGGQSSTGHRDEVTNERRQDPRALGYPPIWYISTRLGRSVPSSSVRSSE
jgi:hypothetical protein